MAGCSNKWTTVVVTCRSLDQKCYYTEYSFFRRGTFDLRLDVPPLQSWWKPRTGTSVCCILDLKARLLHLGTSDRSFFFDVWFINKHAGIEIFVVSGFCRLVALRFCAL